MFSKSIGVATETCDKYNTQNLQTSKPHEFHDTRVATETIPIK